MNFYKPSGQFSLSSLVWLLAVCFLIFPILGLIYAYAIWYIPIFYFNILIAAGFGILIGRIISWGPLKKGKVRNVTMAFLFGLVGGLIALYFHWAVWIDLVFNTTDTVGGDQIGIAISNIKLAQVLYLASDPIKLFSHIQEVSVFGTWGFKGSAVSGGFLVAIWIIELAIIVGLSVLNSLGQAKMPFSEALNEWNEEKEQQAFGLVENLDSILTALSEDDPEPLKQLKTLSTNERHSTFTLFHIDGDDSYLSVTNMIGKLNDKGKLEFDETDLVEYAAVKPQVQDYLLGRT